MVSELARGDWNDLRDEGLAPSLDDFDRLNRLAIRLTDGPETTVANFPRIGWAGDVPFYQPTCQAFAWYLEAVDRAAFSIADKDAAWFYALAHARTPNAFADLTSRDRIHAVVTHWLSSLPVTRDEIARACRYAAVGFDDAEPGKTDAQRAASAAKTEDEKREDSLANLSENVTVASALTGIAPDTLALETPSRLAKMVEAVRANNPMGGGVPDPKPRLTADYQLALREIKLRLIAEKTASADKSSPSPSCARRENGEEVQ